MRPWLGRLRVRAGLARAREAGYAAVMVAIVVPTVGLGAAAVAVDVGNWYVQLEKVQKAADAAALAGVPFLPQDLQAARQRALEVADRNGYDNSTSTNNGHVPNTVTVGLGDKATQLKVTISTTITNQFGSMIGIDRQTLTRSATADYQGPAPMGSPCNTFGNEPNAGNANAGSTPSGNSPSTLNGTGSGTAQSSSTRDYCSRTPSMWATVEGPETGKAQGDRYQTKACLTADRTTVDGCTGTANDEYDDFGYVFVVKVAQAAVGKTVDLQLFDPMMVNTGSNCGYAPSRNTILAPVNAGKNPATLTTKMNPYVTYDDASSRYSSDASSSTAFGSYTDYCTGDSYPGVGTGKSTPDKMVTSFALRQQTDTQNPTVADVVNDTSGNACVSQFGSFNNGKNGTLSTNTLTQGNGSYNDDVAATFHNWYSFCTFTPARAGDYYLQVRTNVAMAGTPRAAVAGATQNLIKNGNDAVLDVAGDSTEGEGSNSFAIRASIQSGLEGAVSVSGYNHMPIYINADTATATFHLIRVLPGAAGQKISFSYFDAGDAASAGSVTVLTPTDATGSITTTPFPGGCTTYGGTAGGSQSSQTTLTNCSAPVSRSGGVSLNNGKAQTITIPIPSDYNCSYNQSSGCWYKVRVAFGTGQVTDVTTWDATVVGDPVRIIK